jgi:hypothetical protein
LQYSLVVLASGAPADGRLHDDPQQTVRVLRLLSNRPKKMQMCWSATTVLLLTINCKSSLLLLVLLVLLAAAQEQCPEDDIVLVTSAPS